MTENRLKRIATAAAAGGLVLGLTACASEPPLEPIGFFAFGHASGTDAHLMCTASFGDVEQLGKKLGVELTYRDGGEGACLYETSDGGQVALGVVDGDVPELDLSATSGTFTVGIATAPPRPPVFSDAKALERLQEWFDRRAEAVVDDYTQWVASLAPVDDGFMSLTDYTVDPLMRGGTEVDLEGKLVTPGRTIEVTGTRQLDYLQLEGRDEFTRAGDGRVFLVASLSGLASGGGPDATQSIHVEVDGTDMGTLDSEGGSSIFGDAVISIPVDADDVHLVVTTDGDPQAISLMDGALHDEGRGERYLQRSSGSTHCDRDDPQVRGADGTVRGRHLAAFDRYVSWDRTPWLSGSGWAGDGQEYLVLSLDPFHPGNAEPVQADDLLVTAKGETLSPVHVDAATYTFTYLIPDGGVDVNARITLTPSAEFLDPDEEVVEPSRMDCNISSQGS